MKHLFYAGILLIFASCGSSSGEKTTEGNPENTYKPLPYLGFHDEVPVKDENGNEVWKKVYYQVPDFEFTNQDSVLVTNKMTDGHVYVANFFFTSCPHICPSMMEHMKRLQEKTDDIEELIILSHTIDPERDSIPRLKEYIQEREIDTRNWHLLYNEREYTHYMGIEGYMLSIVESEEEADGGFLHSEYFVLVDRDRHIRGMYNGTKTEEVDQLAEDIRELIKNEYK